MQEGYTVLLRDKLGLRIRPLVPSSPERVVSSPTKPAKHSATH